MILTIDNLTGLGPLDYTPSVCPATSSTQTAGETIKPLTLARTLNAQSIASCTLDLSASTLPVPVRQARVIITNTSGATLFTGYLATEPVPVYAGAGFAGPVYRYTFSAISDEWLLDKQSLTLTSAGFTVTAGSLLATLANRTAAGVLSTTGITAGQPIGVFKPEPTHSFSTNAGEIAGSTYAAYNAMNGTITLAPVGNTTHTLDFDSGAASGTLQPAALKTTQAKELANDVTVSGETEPSAYVQEFFQGDGTTTLFTLSDDSFHVTKPTLLTDSFNTATFNTQIWQVTDSGAHLTLGAGGLTFHGGNGYDGQTTLAAIDPIELGGSLVIEAASLQLSGASDGVVLGLYSGAISRANCFAGLNITQSGGNTVLSPFVNGMAVGTTYTIVEGHAYTVRLRLHSPEMQRVMQTYYARVDGEIVAFTGGSGPLVDSPMAITVEILDQGNASNTPVTVLYDGAVTTSPATCTFAAADSVQLFGSVGSITVTQSGSAWVVSTLPSGTTYTRLIGSSGQGVDCKLTTTGKLTFFSGRVPVAGELITVFYRTRDRAIARLADSASIASEAAAGLPGTARWLGKVVKPLARSSADCAAAAQAILALATSRANALAGAFATLNPTSDIWPGDVLDITANGQTLNVVVRTVTVEDNNASPELLTYRIAFANDWAEALGITLSEAIASDAFFPTTAQTTPNTALPNLNQLTVQSASSTVLQLDAGTAPPAGGGFEVRLTDWNFGPGPSQDLVLRSPVRGFSIPRTSATERYYIRQYDASTPPNYSALSAAIFTNLPFGS